MVRTFFPELSRSVPASIPHPPGTEYRVSVGMEEWGEKYVPVVKVQMAYDGVVSGRKSPSYPVGTDDLKRVNQAIGSLIGEYKKQK